MLIVLAEGQEAAAIEEASLFVADLLAERLVLAHAKGLFRGGRRFLKPCSLTEAESSRLLDGSPLGLARLIGSLRSPGRLAP